LCTAGASYSLFLKNNGTVWACGDNSYGQLGDGTQNNSSTPVQVNGLCQVLSSVNKNIESLKISVFPNPFEKVFTINGTSEKGVVTIFDITGKEIMQQRTSDVETKIKTGNLLPGFYMLNYVEENKTTNIKLMAF
jgi:alpha-tubulin suppressor-like RCC1 family protein